MAVRTDPATVGQVIEIASTISVDVLIETASAIVDQLATADTDSLLSTAELKNIETYLSAWLYAQRDPQYTSKNTGGAGGSFQGQVGMHFEMNWWGQTAKLMDRTGFLAKMERDAQRGKPKASMGWLGKPPSTQVDYEDRD